MSTVTNALPTAFAQGWLMTAGLIVAIGAQNALVLRQGLARSHVGPVVALCTVSDWLLIALGVFGLGALVQSSPVVLQVLRYGGAAFLLTYGARAAMRALKAAGDALRVAGPAASLASTLGTTLALTYLNPHVYLDTVVLLGSVGAQQRGAGQLAFAAGAGIASAMWFTTLGFGASAASRWLQRPAVWRGIDASIALVMLVVALQLLMNPL
jgi:L-lysine exporter family protein LysE/ArgO